MARETVWLAIASILATFDICKAVDENGREIEPIDDNMPGIVASVGHNPCRTVELCC